MDFRGLAVAALVFLALIGGSHAQDSIPEEAYWKAVWPNTPIPSALGELLKPGAEDVEINYLPMKADDTRYPKNFFFDHDLYPGKTMYVQFIERPVTILLGKVETQEFTYEEVCVKNPISKAEHKYCAKSLGTLIGFAISMLGKNIQVFSSSFVDKQNQYTIEGVQNLGDKAVMCHRLNFQKVVFYCHEIHKTWSYMVSMVAADGTKTQVIAVCHGDTSAMNPDMLYELLKVKVGTVAACHFLGNKEVLWIPNSVVDNSYNTKYMAT